MKYPTPEHTVLLAVTGKSPAVLSETIWALARERPPVIPDEVVVLTTTHAAADFRRLLLERSAGWPCSPWEALRRKILGPDSDSPLLQLATPRIIELPNPQTGIKTPAADIRTATDNDAAADFLLEEVRRLTENHQTRIIVSIAGGRKTMGVLLYAAMSLLGRENDRITHVLVSEPFETCRDFFFPDQPLRKVMGADGRKKAASSARVELADIPFVPLRNLFERELARRPGSFHTLVAEASRKIAAGEEPPALRLHTVERRILIAGHSTDLNMGECILSLLLLRQAQKGAPPFPSQKSAGEAATALCAELRQAAATNDFSDWRGEAPHQCDDSLIRKSLSTLRSKLRNASYDGVVLAKYLVSRPQLAWRIPPDKIEIY